MDQTPYWHKQQQDKPLFPDLEWSRPETKQQAGTLTIIGGNLHAFAAPAQAYEAATTAGVGAVHILLPSALEKVVGHLFIEGTYAPSTPSGSFARTALASWLELADHSGVTLLPGDIGSNAETTLLLETFVSKYNGLLSVAGDALDSFLTHSSVLFERPNTTIIASFSQLQQLFRHTTNIEAPLTSTMSLLKLVETLHIVTGRYLIQIIVPYEKTMLVAVQGQVSTTGPWSSAENLLLPTAAATSVWWCQRPSKPFDALTTGIYDLFVRH